VGSGLEYSLGGQTSYLRRVSYLLFSRDCCVFFKGEGKVREANFFVPEKSTASFRLCLGVVASLRGQCWSRLSSDRGVWSLLTFWEQVLF